MKKVIILLISVVLSGCVVHRPRYDKTKDLKPEPNVHYYEPEKN